MSETGVPVTLNQKVLIFCFALFKFLNFFKSPASHWFRDPSHPIRIMNKEISIFMNLLVSPAIKITVAILPLIMPSPIVVTLYFEVFNLSYIAHPSVTDPPPELTNLGRLHLRQGIHELF